MAWEISIVGAIVATRTPRKMPWILGLAALWRQYFISMSKPSISAFTILHGPSLLGTASFRISTWNSSVIPFLNSSQFPALKTPANIVSINITGRCNGIWKAEPQEPHPVWPRLETAVRQRSCPELRSSFTVSARRAAKPRTARHRAGGWGMAGVSWARSAHAPVRIGDRRSALRQCSERPRCGRARRRRREVRSTNARSSEARRSRRVAEPLRRRHVSAVAATQPAASRRTRPSPCLPARCRSGRHDASSARCVKQRQGERSAAKPQRSEP